MKILHAPVEIAGQVGLSAFGQREIGHVAHTYFPPHPFSYALPPDFYPRSANPIMRKLDKLRLIGKFIGEYELFHFHFAHSFLPEKLRYLDARLLKRLGRRVMAEFWGSDVRLPSIEARRNPYFENSYNEDETQNRKRLARWADITQGRVIVSDHYFDIFLEPFFPHIHVVGQRVDTKLLAPNFPDPEKRAPLVVHAPSQKAFKGSEQVQRAVDSLKAKGMRFDYREVFGVSHGEAMQIYREADLIVDQIKGGSHGVFAVEAMSLGKPVICYILPELVPTYPEGFPIINANPETLESILEEWLQRPQDRYHLGVRSREYAERVHDCRVVAAKLIDVYNAH